MNDAPIADARWRAYALVAPALAVIAAFFVFPLLLSAVLAGVKELGRDLKVEAFSGKDNIVEALRYQKANFVMGVQWHPEFHRPGDSELLDCTPILDGFLRAARETRL